MTLLAAVRAEAIRLRDWAAPTMTECRRRWLTYPPIPPAGSEDGLSLPDKESRRAMRRAWPHRARGVATYSIPRSWGDLEVIARSSVWLAGVKPPGVARIETRAKEPLAAWGVLVRAATVDEGRVEVWALGGQSPELFGLALDRDGAGWLALPQE